MFAFEFIIGESYEWKCISMLFLAISMFVWIETCNLKKKKLINKLRCKTITIWRSNRMRQSEWNVFGPHSNQFIDFYSNFFLFSEMFAAVNINFYAALAFVYIVSISILLETFSILKLQHMRFIWLIEFCLISKRTIGVEFMVFFSFSC